MFPNPIKRIVIFVNTCNLFFFNFLIRDVPFDIVNIKKNKAINAKTLAIIKSSP